MTENCINAALVDTIKALGGSKVVGPLLYPEKPLEAAQRALLDALNPERPARLSPEQVVFIARLARRQGCHVLMAHLCTELGYAPPVPVEPADQAAQLQREFVTAVAALQGLAARLDALGVPAPALRQVA